MTNEWHTELHYECWCYDNRRDFWHARYTPEYLAQLDADLIAMELAEQSEESEGEGE